MSSVLPHSGTIRAHVRDYCSEVSEYVVEALGRSEAESAMVLAYKTALALDCSLGSIARSARPSIKFLRVLNRQILVHIAIGLEEAALTEMRRLMEGVVLSLYYSDHPVEYERMARDPSTAIVKGIDRPISFCAHREPTFYFNYVKDRMSDESSGQGKAAVDVLATQYRECSVVVHAKAASLDRRPLRLVHMDARVRESVAKRHRIISSAVCILVSARWTAAFGKLGPVQRAWFDWLVGTQRAKAIRGAQFGLGSI